MRVSYAPMSVLKWALTYNQSGFDLVPLRCKEKGCKVKNWPSLDFNEDIIGNFGNAGGVAIKLTNGLVHVDLDCPEAIHFADSFLPDTEMISGRESARTAHRFYTVKGVLQNVKCESVTETDCEKKTIIEVHSQARGKGFAVPVEPSIHPSGEFYRWWQFADPAETDETLIQQVYMVAVATELARIGFSGTRHDLVLRAASVLLRYGWSVERTGELVTALCAWWRDEDKEDRLAAIRTTSERITADEAVTTDEDLAEFFGNLQAFEKWLKWVRNVANEPPQNGPKGKKQSAVKTLIDFGSAQERFVDPTGTAYVKIEFRGHKRFVEIESQKFKDWLQIQAKEIGLQSVNPIDDATRVLARISRADKEVPVRKTAVRVGGNENETWFQLGHDRFVRLTAEGWTLETECSIPFLTYDSHVELPTPLRGGDLTKLKGVLGLKNDFAWVAICSWMVASLLPHGPYFVLIVQGPQGSGKSTLCDHLKRIIDPEEGTGGISGPERVLVDNLMRLASKRWVISLENLSYLSQEFSDVVSVLSTGGKDIRRKLFTDDEEKQYSVRRPIILNGISEFAKSADLLDRSIMAHLDLMPDGERKLAEQIEADFSNVLPEVLGGLFDAYCFALQRIAEGFTCDLHRQADAARIACAAEPKFQAKCCVQDVLEETRTNANSQVLDSSPLAQMLIELADYGGWIGTSSELWEKLKIDGIQQKDPSLRLRNIKERIDRLRPALDQVGITFDYPRRATGRFIRIWEKAGKTPRIPGEGSAGQAGNDTSDASDAEEPRVFSMQAFKAKMNASKRDSSP